MFLVAESVVECDLLYNNLTNSIGWLYHSVHDRPMMINTAYNKY